MTDQPPHRPARSPLTERRKADTRTDIARAACELFAERGADGTTAEEIARAAGVGLRTFYRYFRAKEDAVEPMLSDGARRWLTLIAEGPRELPGPRRLEEIAVHALTPDGDATDEAMRRTGGLLRAAEDDPALRAVWYRINLESEKRLVGILAELAGPSADPLVLRMTATAAAGAIRIAVEQWAADPQAPTSGPGSPSDLVLRSMRGLTAGIPGRAGGAAQR